MLRNVVISAIRGSIFRGNFICNEVDVEAGLNMDLGYSLAEGNNLAERILSR